MSIWFTIGKLAKETGTKVNTIRYYEEIGMMPEPARTEGNQRRYQQQHVNRLAFIRHSRALGFSLDQIRSLLDLQDRPDHSCETADRIARENLAEVESRIARLQSLKSELTRMIDQCSHGTVADCRVVETLANHGLCETRDS